MANSNGHKGEGSARPDGTSAGERAAPEALDENEWSNNERAGSSGVSLTARRGRVAAETLRRPGREADAEKGASDDCGAGKRNGLIDRSATTDGGGVLDDTLRSAMELAGVGYSGKIGARALVADGVEVGASMTEKRGEDVSERMTAERGAPVHSNAFQSKAELGTAELGAAGPTTARRAEMGGDAPAGRGGAPRLDDSSADAGGAEVGGADHPPGPTSTTESAPGERAAPRTQASPGAYSLGPGRGSRLLSSAAAILAEIGRESAAEEEEAPAVDAPVSAISPDEVGADEEGNVIATAVTDASAVVYAEKVRRDRSKAIKVGACALALAGVVAGVAVAAVVGVRYGGGEARAAGKGPPWSACVPPEGDGPPSTTARHEGFRQTILTFPLYDTTTPGGRAAAQALEEPCGPQNRALTWLADDDELVLGSSWTHRERFVQRFAAATFFFSTNGPQWVDRLDWLSEAHECEWDGIECGGGDAAPERLVTGLSLKDGDEAGGRLPREIGLLTGLVDLQIGRRGIGGNIPTEAGKLSKLVELFAHKNQLTGPLPEELFSSRMSSLAILNLAGNSLSGSLPQNIGDSNLGVLAMPGNKISGTLPSSFVNMEKMFHFMMADNLLTGTVPVDIDKLNRSIAFFDVSRNNMEGTLPDSMTSLLFLNCLGLSENRFSGTLPAVPQCLGRLAVGGNLFDRPVVSKETCAHFDRYKDKNAIICGMDTETCPCCQECPTKGVFCLPGLEADLPGDCVVVKPPLSAASPTGSSAPPGAGGSGAGPSQDGPPPDRSPPPKSVIGESATPPGGGGGEGGRN